MNGKVVLLQELIWQMQEWASTRQLCTGVVLQDELGRRLKPEKEFTNKWAKTAKDCPKERFQGGKILIQICCPNLWPQETHQPRTQPHMARYHPPGTSHQTMSVKNMNWSKTGFEYTCTESFATSVKASWRSCKTIQCTQFCLSTEDSLGCSETLPALFQTYLAIPSCVYDELCTQALPDLASFYCQIWHMPVGLFLNCKSGLGTSTSLVSSLFWLQWAILRFLLSYYPYSFIARNTSMVLRQRSGMSTGAGRPKDSSTWDYLHEEPHIKEKDRLPDLSQQPHLMVDHSKPNHSRQYAFCSRTVLRHSDS